MGSVVRFSLMDLASVRVRPRFDEASAVVLQVCAQVTPRGSAVGIAPAVTASSLRLGADGSVEVVGGVGAEDEQTVSLLGHLLLDSIGPPEGFGADAPPSLRSLGLCAAASRPKPVQSLAEFVDALRRHSPLDVRAAVRALWERGASRLLSPSPGETSPSLNQGPPASIRRVAGSRRVAARVALVAAMVLCLVLAGGAFWLLDELAPPPPPAPAGPPPSTRPLDRPGWELLDRRSGMPVRAVTAHPHLSPVGPDTRHRPGQVGDPRAQIRATESPDLSSGPPRSADRSLPR